MDLKPGSRWRSAVCDAEFVVVRPPKSPVSLECGGHPVIPHAEAKAGDLVLSDAHAAGSAAGKRYADAGNRPRGAVLQGGRGLAQHRRPPDRGHGSQEAALVGLSPMHTALLLDMAADAAPDRLALGPRPTA